MPKDTNSLFKTAPLPDSRACLGPGGLLLHKAATRSPSLMGGPGFNAGIKEKRQKICPQGTRQEQAPGVTCLGRGRVTHVVKVTCDLPLKNPSDHTGGQGNVSREVGRNHFLPLARGRGAPASPSTELRVGSFSFSPSFLNTEIVLSAERGFATQAEKWNLQHLALLCLAECMPQKPPQLKVRVRGHLAGGRGEEGDRPTDRKRRTPATKKPTRRQRNQLYLRTFQFPVRMFCLIFFSCSSFMYGIPFLRN